MKFRLRTVVAGLLLTTIIPLANSARLLISESWNQQLAVVTQQNVDRARAIRIAVDQLIESSVAVLAERAQSPLLDNGRPDQEWAEQILRYQPSWSGLQLMSPSGELLLEAGTPYRSETTPDWIASVSASDAPLISDLESDGERYFVVIAVPVVRGGQLRSVLAAQIDSSRFSEILRNLDSRDDVTVGLNDRSGHLMARNRDEERFVGQPPRQSSLDARGQLEEGSYRSTTREGTPIYSGFSRSPVTGWSVGIGLPAEQFEGPIRQSLTMLTTIHVFMLVLGIGSALLLGRSFTKAVESMSHAAVALVRGDAVRVKPSRIKEIAELTGSLKEAGRIMDMRLSEQQHAQAEQRRAAEEQELVLAAEREARKVAETKLASTLNSVGDAVIAVSLKGTVTLLNEAAQLLTGWSESDAVGQPIELVLNLRDGRSSQAVDPVSRSRQEGLSVKLTDDTILVTRSGREFQVEGNASPVRGKDGPLLGTVVIFRDALDKPRPPLAS